MLEDAAAEGEDEQVPAEGEDEQMAAEGGDTTDQLTGVLDAQLDNADENDADEDDADEDDADEDEGIEENFPVQTETDDAAVEEEAEAA